MTWNSIAGTQRSCARRCGGNMQRGWRRQGGGRARARSTGQMQKGGPLGGRPFSFSSSDQAWIAPSPQARAASRTASE